MGQGCEELAALNRNAEALRRSLEGKIEGEARFDPLSRALYATDASVYQIMPAGVVIPRVRDDAVAAVRAALSHGVPITPRGAGTSLGGQAIGTGLVVDFSKYMNRVIKINSEERWAWVEPGIVLDDLNAALGRMGLQFAPDVATSNRATIGGMIGNNSAGARSLLYGKTIDHVLELDVILGDGNVARFSQLDGSALEAKQESDGLESHCHRIVTQLAREHADEIERRYPKIMRRVAGYNLDEFVPGRPFNLSKIIVGAEGTLAVVVAARIRLTPLPKAKSLLVIHFADLRDALKASAPILAHNPAAIEFLDRNVLERTKDSLEYARLRGFVVGDPDGLLIVEFFGESKGELAERSDRLEQDLRACGIGYHYHRAIEKEAQAQIWKLRKASLGLVMATKGDAKPIPFVEDAAVAPERLAEFVDRFIGIVEANGTTAAFYGHASVGALHLRPIINLKTDQGVRQFETIAGQVADLVLEFGGALSAEHGDGRVRSPFLEKMFGPTLCGAFRQIKATFDPQGLFNPRIIVDPGPMTANLRYGAGYRTPEIATAFDFSADGGIVRAAEACSGVGLCRKRTEETMCPSFMATLEEQHSTRGRANILRLAMTGVLGSDGLVSREALDALELCLECKACKAECPISVDVAKLKYEFLHQYYRRHGTPLRAKLFAHIERLMALGSRFAPLSTWLVRSLPGRLLLDKMFGIDRRRRLPPFARRTFAKWFTARGGRVGHIPDDADPARSIVLFHDTFMTYAEPQIGAAVVRLLEAAGWRVFLPHKRCCGRPMISKGLLDEAIANATYNVESLYPLAERGFRIVGCEPSCVSAFRDDYLDLLRGELRKRAERVAPAFLTFEEFLADTLENGTIALSFGMEGHAPSWPTCAPNAGSRNWPRHILFHGHCHQKALFGADAARLLLSRIPGCEVTEIDSGCCGMAGAFGYEKEHYELSRQIGERRLLRAVREADSDTVVVASGTSCRQQIRDLTGKDAYHPAELLASLALGASS